MIYLIDASNNNKVVRSFDTEEEKERYLCESFANLCSNETEEEYYENFFTVSSEEMEEAVFKNGSRMKNYWT